MTQVEIGAWIEEAFRREGVGRDSWSFSDPEHSSVNGGMDVQVDFELKYRGTPEQSEKLSLLAPRTLGAPDATARIEVFIEAVCEKVRAIKGRLGLPGAKKILVVADDYDLTHLMGLLFERDGYQVVFANDGRTALRKASEQKPDLIFHDVMLPGLPGLEVAEVLKGADETRDIPIIIFSAEDRSSIIERARSIGVNHYIKKPLYPEALLETVAVVLGVNREAKELLRHAAPPERPAAKKVKDPYRLTGTVLDGKYKLVEYAGGGGMGAVYRALKLEGQEIAAIKILKPDIVARSPEYAELFERETKNAQSLDHPHIVKVFDSGRDDELSYMAMEWVDGDSIEDVITQGQLSIDRLINIFEQICSAVAAAHEKSIIHLDIKPANILLLDSAKPKDFVKVIDFGLSRVLTRESGTTVTKFRGTDKYCAPEQFGGRVSHRSDIYSLGATLYHMICGVIPFGMSYINAKMHPNLELPEIPSVTRQRDVPSEVDLVIKKALDKNPDLRQQSAKQLFEEFHNAMSSDTSEGQQPLNENIDQGKVQSLGSQINPTRVGPDLKATVYLKVRSYDRLMEYALIVGLINKSAKRIADFRIEVEVPNAFTNQSTTYVAEVGERRTQTTRYFRAESKDRANKILYPGDRMREFFIIDLTLPPGSSGGDTLDQKIIVKVFVGDDMTHRLEKSVRNLLGQPPSFG